MESFHNVDLGRYMSLYTGNKGSNGEPGTLQTRVKLETKVKQKGTVEKPMVKVEKTDQLDNFRGLTVAKDSPPENEDNDPGISREFLFKPSSLLNSIPQVTLNSYLVLIYRSWQFPEHSSDSTPLK